MEKKYFDIENKLLNVEWISLEINPDLYYKVKKEISKLIKIIEKDRKERLGI